MGSGAPTAEMDAIWMQNFKVQGEPINKAGREAYAYQPGDKIMPVPFGLNFNMAGAARGIKAHQAFKKQPAATRQEATQSPGKRSDKRVDLLGGGAERREHAGGPGEGNLGRKTLLGA